MKTCAGCAQAAFCPLASVFEYLKISKLTVHACWLQVVTPANVTTSTTLQGQGIATSGTTTSSSQYTSGSTTTGTGYGNSTTGTTGTGTGYGTTGTAGTGYGRR